MLQGNLSTINVNRSGVDLDEALIVDAAPEAVLDDLLARVIAFASKNPEVQLPPERYHEAVAMLGQQEVDELPRDSRARLAAVLMLRDPSVRLSRAAHEDVRPTRVTVLRRDLLALLAARGFVPADEAVVPTAPRCNLTDVEYMTMMQVVRQMENERFDSTARTLRTIIAASGRAT